MSADSHKIYTPEDIIAETRHYEGKMSFKNQFSLKFRYKMRSFNDINQKMAFLDLISNILNVTYRRATFWGGEVRWIGSKQDQRPFDTSNAIINKSFDKVGGLWNQLFDSNSPLRTALSSMNLSDIMGAISGGIGDLMEKGKEMLSGGMEKLSEMTEAVGTNMINTGKGAVKNRLGRPQVYALNSLLTGAATGPWHVTIGNPFNPIVVMGNMIIDSVELSHTGALTIDDFPEEIILKISLSHGKPRDITNISKMYTRGYGELYASPKSKQLRVMNKKITR